MREVEVVTCDACGKPAEDSGLCHITMHWNGEIAFEWWLKGDYCEECLDRLSRAIVAKMPTNERYDSRFRDHEAEVEDEVALLRDYEEGSE